MSDLKEELKKLNELNETKGREREVLEKVTAFRNQAESQGDWEMVAHSFWLEHLAHQHLIMNGEADAASHAAQMLTAAQEAFQLVELHELTTLKGDAHRFLGRGYTFTGDHQNALVEYQTASGILKLASDPRYLEVDGFRAESLIRTGEVNGGLNLAYATFDAYDFPPATELHDQDYYTWAVWRSGIFPRLVKALDELKIDYDKAKIKDYIQKSQEFLNDPAKFSYRLAEINDVLAKL